MRNFVKRLSPKDLQHGWRMKERISTCLDWEGGKTKGLTDREAFHIALSAAKAIVPLRKQHLLKVYCLAVRITSLQLSEILKHNRETGRPKFESRHFV